jgi:CHAT domain-containing protein
MCNVRWNTAAVPARMVRRSLVSHWPVNSGEAVKLTTRAFKELEQHPDIGRAEALRQAMLATIAEGGAQAHPSYWAPFIVVGEGSRL